MNGRQMMIATVAPLAVLVALTSPRAGESGPLLYYEEAGQVVFTNVPRPDARPVPGIDDWKNLDYADPRLPTTVFDPYIEHVAYENGLPPALVKAVALVESGLDTHAVSPKGARGLMQLMPETARQYGVNDAFDPLQNLRAGAAHLRGLLDEFDGNLTLALAAYNAGSGAVRRHGGVPAFRETQNYVRKVHETLGRQPRRRRPPERATTSAVRLERDANGSIKFVN